MDILCAADRARLGSTWGATSTYHAGVYYLFTWRTDANDPCLNGTIAMLFAIAFVVFFVVNNT